MPRVGVCLSGCGVQDGTEIHEAVLTLLALDRAGAEIVCMAPDAPQAKVVNHLTGQATDETRNVLVESARIARGDIRDLATVTVDDIDALIFPGGFGAALNLSSFATQGSTATVHPEVRRLVLALIAERKPLGAICIAPAMLAAAVKGQRDRIEVTIGDDAGTAAEIEKTGALHHNRAVDDICFDDTHLIVTTPAYMLGSGPAAVFPGIEKLVQKVLSLADEG